ncbi:TPA: hypothetical protein ACW0NO_002502 [Enterobacter ludwigii]|jgi:hypothetical protein|uniref:hypothetical protein n=1 Tax=Enterobacter TaxID=547 RepID=UPI0009C0830F|nr:MULTISPECIES: hypothetical protein [Enterobacter]GJK54068.1 hypothetical protein TUM17561_14860 [Enterobacter cloacae]AVO99516.1 hypothetical protein AM379_03605 [Enterobacter cloacae complex sp. FDA-CDC-AR_0132]AWC85025.1 hypothetical protein AM410_11505 [Enterobacter cloacae complex sp. FDA-CDC-AR_0164]EKS7108270.1 hypothetical protein [Enterobacter ludwigii]KAA0524469.1 hypothetical protein F0325_01980 [Enterobacter ludwigii]
MASIVQNLLVAHFMHPGYPEINPINSRVSMAIGKRQNQKELPEEELDRLLDDLELTQEQREFIESMRQNNENKNNEE